MAVASPSPLAASTETTNGVKLRRLLVDGGTTVLRKVFDGIHPPTKLTANLHLNTSTLDNLFARGILSEQQRNRLYPTDGSKPHSKTFDITLLFLLLTEICGLSPPSRTGWNHKPQAKNKSLSANLVRIKLFRNKLIHTPETRIDSRLFNELWKEISGALVSLGLDQAEINRLKTERCGEEDYLDVLFKWADREKEIKSMLEEVCQSQTKLQKAIETVGQTQQEQQKILQDTKTAAETVSQTQQEHLTLLQGAKATLEQTHKTQQGTKSKLDTIQKSQAKMQETVERVHHTQVEDHETLQDNKSKLDKVHQTQSKTQETVGEVRQTQLEDRETFLKSVEELKEAVDSLKERRDKDKSEEVLRNLAKAEFKGDIDYLVGRYQQGTREWLFNEVENWLDDRNSENRVMVISSNAGMGKSVISAVICKRMQEAGILAGSHFCQHNNVRYRIPQLMLQSLAYHLSQTLPEYKKSLVEQLSRNLGPVERNSMGVEELFALLFKEPLNIVKDPGRNILMVIDGLDESEYQGRNELLDVIANQFSMLLPEWIRFFVTTRPEINIADSLKHLQPTHLHGNQEENLRDIRLFFEMQLSPRIVEEKKEFLLTKLVEKSEGSFLYAYFRIDHIEENVPLLTLEQLESSLPLGISSVFLTHFKRLENELCKELKMDEEQVLSFLSAFTASREPMPVAFVSRLLSPGRKSLSSQRRINKAVASISSLLPVRNGCLHFFHKSIKDWLTNTSCYERHDFTVDETEGHGILFDLCRNELDNIKQKGVHNSPFSDTEKYALQHGVQHMIELIKSDEIPRPCDVEDLINAYVIDLELIYAKLCVNSTASSEDIFSVQKHIKPTLLGERSQPLLISLRKVLKKHSYLLREHPHLWFQSVINEGSPELSYEAANILENRLPTVPYMKYSDKKEENGSVQARFYCSSTVACFDVSPEMDYMVCECRDGTIHMWSLETGNLEWSRPSLINRKFEYVRPKGDVVSDNGAYRRAHSRMLTFYRSVVFHPSGTSILPGTLRSAYTLEGDCNSLYPNSNCTFSRCAFPADKRTILTDCFDDPMELVLWSMESGHKLWRIAWNDNITSFAISQDGSQIAFADGTSSIYLYVAKEPSLRLLYKLDVPCGMMQFTQDSEALVCGYLPYKMEDGLGYGQYGWVSYRKPAFILCRFKTKSLSQEDFILWPIEPKIQTVKSLFGDDFLLGRVKNVRSVFPSLETGFYKWLDNGTALVGSPSFKYVAAIHVDSLSKVDRAFTRQAVEEVVFSSEGDVIYSVISKDDGSASGVLLTVFRMSSQELMVEKSCPSLSLVPVKEGVVLCLKHKVPELWNFELTKCIRQFPKLKETEKLIRLSDELIACERCRCTSTPEELSDFGYPSGKEDSLELRVEDDSVEKDEALRRYFSKDDAFYSPWKVPYFTFLPFDVVAERSDPLFGTFSLDIVNVTSGECVSSIEARVCLTYCAFVSCNSQNQLLLCICEEIEDDFFEGENLTVSLTNNNSVSCVWKREAARYDTRSFTPYFMFSPQEEFVVTWASFRSGCGVHILDAKTGETQHTLLKDQDDIVDCKFVVNGESLVCCSEDNFLRLFNIRSGDLLSMLDIEEQPCCLGACLDKPLVAIGLWGTRLKFVHVKLPGVQDAEGKKGSLTNRGELDLMHPVVGTVSCHVGTGLQRSTASSGTHCVS